MYAILIIVSITLHGHQHRVHYTSAPRYAASDCAGNADAMAERIARRIAKTIKPSSALVKSVCEKQATRSI